MAELILVRHAEAEEIKSSDQARRLTKKGQKQAKMLSKTLAKDIDQCDLFAHSGIIRAKQTLEIMIGQKENWNIMVTSALKHEAKAIELGKWLKVHAEDLQKVILVGHEPHLSRFLGWAIARSNQTQFEIKKGAVIRLEIVDFSLIMKRRMILKELIPLKALKR